MQAGALGPESQIRPLDYLKDVENLPAYFPGMKDAHREGPDHDADRVEAEANVGGITVERIRSRSRSTLGPTPEG